MRILYNIFKFVTCLLLVGIIFMGCTTNQEKKNNIAQNITEDIYLDIDEFVHDNRTYTTHSAVAEEFITKGEIKEIIDNDLSRMDEIVKENIDANARKTTFPSMNESLVVDDDGNVSVKVGYTLNNDYYHAILEACLKGGISQWDWVESELVMKDVQSYVDLASEELFKEFHEKEYGDNFLDKKIAVSHFQGGDSSKYVVYIEHEFKVKKDYVVVCAGNITSLEEEGWYGGTSFITLVNSDDGYITEAIGTTPTAP